MSLSGSVFVFSRATMLYRAARPYDLDHLRRNWASQLLAFHTLPRQARLARFHVESDGKVTRSWPKRRRNS